MVLKTLTASLAAVSMASQPQVAADAGPTKKPQLTTLGYIEMVNIGDLELRMLAKLDTGADTSSVHAYDVEVYERENGDEWVRFRLIGDDERRIRYDKKVVRNVRIKKKAGGHIRRPVVSFDICVGGVRAEAEFNLADRDVFSYPALLGREFLAKRILVDSGKRLTADESCGPTDDD